MADNVDSLPDSLNDALSILSHELNRRSIRYALIGGIAAGVRGRPRFTDDIDILLTVPQLQLPGLLESLQSRGFSFDLMETIREFTQHHLVVMRFGDVRVDWMKPPIPAYQHVLDSATNEQWRGHELRIATAEGLILLKLVAGRTQDWADIESLLVANRGKLDLEWIEREWCTIAGADDPRWRKFEVTMREFFDAKSPGG